MNKYITVFLRFSIFAALYSLALIVPMDAAHAKLKICNETGKNRDVAIGHRTSEGWVSEGWWGIVDGDCTTVIKEDLTSRFYYYRAKHKGGDFDGEDYIFCTESRAFTIIGDKDCKKRGFKTEDFRQLELVKGTTGFTLTLDDTSIYSTDRKTAKITKQKPASKPASVPSGTHGEPYDEIAIFKGCDRIDGLLSCEFDANGARYIILDDGKTDEALLNQVDAFPLGHRYRILGDIKVFGDITFEATLRQYQDMGDDAIQVRMNRLTGLWRSNIDPSSTIRFFDDYSKFDYSDGQLISQGNVSFTTKCQDSSVGETGTSFLQVQEGADFYCYDVIENTEEKLVLMYLPRGNFLEYRKDLGLN